MGSLYNVLYNFMKLVDTTYGPIQQLVTTKGLILNKNQNIGEFDKVYYSRAESLVISKNSPYKILGGGCSLNKTKSSIKALGECIERWCSIIYDNRNMLNGSYYNLNAMGEKVVDPQVFQKFSKEFYDGDKRLNYYDDQLVDWTLCWDYIKKDICYIPAQFIYLSHPGENSELQLVERTSNGMACGDNYDSALLSALYEVIERDSFIITWVTKSTPKILSVDKLFDNEAQILYNFMKKIFKNKFKIFNITKFSGVHTFAGVIYDPKNKVRFAISTASHLNPEKCIIKVIEELVLTYMNYFENYEKYIIEANHMVHDYELIDDFFDHGILYLHECMDCELDFFVKSKKYINLTELVNHEYNDNSKNVKYIIDLLKKEKISVYSADITPNYIREFDIFVVKVLLPELETLNSNHSYMLTNSDRIAKFSQGIINSAPHPFP